MKFHTSSHKLILEVNVDKFDTKDKKAISGLLDRDQEDLTVDELSQFLEIVDRNTLYKLMKQNLVKGKGKKLGYKEFIQQKSSQIA